MNNAFNSIDIDIQSEECMCVGFVQYAFVREMCCEVTIFVSHYRKSSIGNRAFFQLGG